MPLASRRPINLHISMKVSDMKDEKRIYQQPESELFTLKYEYNIMSGEKTNVTVTDPWEDEERKW